MLIQLSLPTWSQLFNGLPMWSAGVALAVVMLILFTFARVKKRNT